MYDIKIGSHITLYEKDAAYDNSVQLTIEKAKAAATEELFSGSKNSDSFELNSSTDTDDSSSTYANYAMYKALSKTSLFSELSEQSDTVSPTTFFTALENLKTSAQNNDTENIATNFDEILSLLKQLSSK